MLKCDFENVDFCTWAADDSWIGSFRIAKQQTLTKDTGPNEDHTLGVGKEGNTLNLYLAEPFELFCRYIRSSEYH